jgi:hypothetical protein
MVTVDDLASEAEIRGFRDWIGHVEERFGTKQAVAHAMGLSASAYTRGVERGSFSTENLLRLAQATGDGPSVVLRAAGKGESAALIEALYGQNADDISGEERELLTAWRLVTDRQTRRVLLNSVQLHADLAQRATASRSRHRSAAAPEGKARNTSR